MNGLVKVLSCFGVLMLCMGITWAQPTSEIDSQKSKGDNNNRIELLCKLDHGGEVRYTIDMAEKKLYVTALLDRGLGGLPINVSDAVIQSELRHEGTLFQLFWLDRFTLDMRSYGALFKELTKDKDGWVTGRCEILKRLI